MAGYQAIAATSHALRLLLDNAAAGSEWGAQTVEVFQTGQLQKPLESGKWKLSIYLYRVLVSTVRRDRGPRVDVDGRTYRPSLPVDLHYLVTAWAKEAPDAQRLLGWAMRTIDDTPALPASLLNSYSAEPVFAEHEDVELLWEPLTLGDLYNIWQVAQDNQAPSAAYIARMVNLDSRVELFDSELVHQRRFDYAGSATS
jgi:hypothetical protein